MELHLHNDVLRLPFVVISTANSRTRPGDGLFPLGN